MEKKSNNGNTMKYGAIDTEQSMDTFCEESFAVHNDSQPMTKRSISNGILALVCVSLGAMMVHFSGAASGRDVRAAIGSSLATSAEIMPSLEKIPSPWKFKSGKERYYTKQQVDHFDDDNKKTWSQRYYTSDRFFRGPGSPILLTIGGEDDTNDLLYPFVNERLAKTLGAYSLEPEHRFYGKSLPIKVKHNTDLIGLLTVEQAMQDILQLLEYTRKKLGCSPKRSSKKYCPVITVGGSYPGFLSALIRIVHPDQIDISYAASAPLLTYSQDMDPNAYFELVSRTAEQASPGCAASAKETLVSIHETIVASNSYLEEAKKMNICLDYIPDYVNTNEAFARTITMMVGGNFADFNMMNYPPDSNTDLAKACHIFQNEDYDIYQQMDHIFQLVDNSNGFEREACGFNMMSQVPAGTNATISTADWSGSGDGLNGLSWEFQMCTELVVRTGFSERSMFYPREWTLEWLTEHCQSRFGLEPNPYYLVEKFQFTNLTDVSHILFTNGLNDGWSVGSFLSEEGLGPNIKVLNFPNGAHHSDLQSSPVDYDTPDIVEGYSLVEKQLVTWIDDLKKHRHH